MKADWNALNLLYRLAFLEILEPVPGNELINRLLVYEYPTIKS